MEVNQVVPGISYGDAVSNDAIALRDVLRENGLNSNIYARYIQPKLAHLAKPLNKFRGNRSNIVIYQYYGGAQEVTAAVMKMPDIKIMRYHNITPPHFFNHYDLHLKYSGTNALRAIRDYHTHFLMGLGVSEFNRQELIKYGFTRTDVLPIFFDFDRFRVIEREKNRDGVKKIIFVGRLSPNKKQDDIIKIFYYYHTFINEKSKLILVGKKQFPAYVNELEQLTRQLGMEDAVEMTGHIGDQDLNWYYCNSDIFLSMSEHEGFGVPFLEAMQLGLPIIAYKSTAIPYILDNCGILIKKKNFREIAELIHIVMNDDTLRNKITDGQKRRLNDFTKDVLTKKLFEIIDAIHTMDLSSNQG